MTASVEHRGGRGRALVLLHGIASTWRDWAPVVPDLERDHEVLALGYPGHDGRPTFAAGIRPGVEALVDGVCEAMDEVGLETAVVAGSSLGGWVALRVAARGRADAVVALSPAGLFDPREARSLRRRLLLQQRVARLAAPFAGAVARSPWLAGVAMGGRRGAERPLEVARKLRAFAHCPVLADLLADLESMGPAGLDAVDCPVVIGWGVDDPLLPVRFADRFAREIPSARVTRLAGSGHLPTWDDPAAVAGLVRSVARGAPFRHAGRQ